MNVGSVSGSSNKGFTPNMLLLPKHGAALLSVNTHSAIRTSAKATTDVCLVEHIYRFTQTYQDR
jgi:hypothetical protein